uniref:Uncharacterized protein n=1 Tax=Sphaerodactylus townsendi TaxID=933632 RepID=A0ACB8EVB4_9SAUR
MLRLVALIILLPPMDWRVHTMMYSKLDPLPILYEQYQPGDFLLGGITSLIICSLHPLNFEEHPSEFLLEAPSCQGWFGMSGLFWDHECSTSEQWSQISFYLYSKTSTLFQLSYGSFAPEDMDGRKFPSFYRMVPNEDHQHTGIVHLLLHFKWTWVGLLLAEDESGEHFAEVLEPELSRNEICLAFTERIQKQFFWDSVEDINKYASNIYRYFPYSNASALIFYGESMALIPFSTFMFMADPHVQESASFKKVWITTAQIDFVLGGHQRNGHLQYFQGAISFTVHTKEVLGFQTFLQHVTFDQASVLQLFWEQAFNCEFRDPSEMWVEGACTGNEKLESLPGLLFDMHMAGHSYSIYNAVYAAAHALHDFHSSRFSHRAEAGGRRFEFQHVQPWQVMSMQY